MTFFSYTISFIRGKEFKEPQLLTKLLYRQIHTSRLRGVENMPGWIIHLSIGYIFIAIMDCAFLFSGVQPSLWWGMIFGTGLGIIGVAGWKILFAIHPNPPEIHFREFYIQLLIAHIIFGLVGSLGYVIETFPN